MREIAMIEAGPHLTVKRGFGDALKSQINVLHALVLHDIKSRFFGNGLGYLVMIAWPAIHLLGIVLINTLSGRLYYGSSAFLYAATGVLPFICWNYISRFCIVSVLQNKTYLSYSLIKILDIMVARIILECISMFIVISLMFLIFLFMGIDVTTSSPQGVFGGIMSSVFLGIGFGILHGSITSVIPLWNIVYILFIITCWVTSGVAINPEGFPEGIAYLFSFNPLLHSIEWVRSSYYPDYPHHLLDKSYVLEVSFVSLALGLVLQKLLAPYRAL